MRFYVRLTPKGGRDGLEGWASGADNQLYLKARVRAVPEDGKANAALLTLLAKELDVRKADIEIVSGQTARLKAIEILGDPEQLCAKLTFSKLKDWSL